MKKVKRYALELDMYVYANSDKEAKEFTEKIQRLLNGEFDCNARAKRLFEIPFASLSAREVQLNNK